jgi:hypothetical protein
VSVGDVRWIARLDDEGAWAPVGFYPLWQSVWWPEIVNATLLGYVPAALVIARRGIDRDLSQLRPRLPSSDAEIADLRAAAIRTSGFAGRAFKLGGIVSGFVFVFIDPSISLGAEPSLTNPAFVWALIRMPVLSWMICTLIVSDLNATRTYFHIGRNLIEVDLLDVQSLSSFARRGLRSALMWVIFSIILSLFWLGEGVASPHNFHLLVALLTMATVAFVVPLVGVHHRILSVKRLELDRLRDEIRVERAAVVDGLSDENPASPRLANLIAYQQLIDRTREWPIDAANLLRFFVYLLIGLGSWLGGAVVERLLDRTLGA